jgi:threonine/homoserine/homoserine lactone efflux protein
VLDSLLAFVAVSAVVICTPGQDTALTIRNTLTGGRRPGVATAAGICLGIVVWAIAASIGLAALLRASEPVFQALKLAGAAYLVYLGAMSLVSAVRRGTRASPSFSTALSPARAFRQGLLSNLGNPKIAVFFASLLPQFVPEGAGALPASLALGLAFCALGFVWLSGYALVVARVGDALKGNVRRALDAIAGVVLVALGLRLATDRS